jgi:uridine kinase
MARPLLIRHSARTSRAIRNTVAVPAGLDGNPDPVVTPERDRVLDAVANLVCAHSGPRTLVGVDGRSGAGKSTFADELAERLASRDRVAVRSTTDSFHRPRTVRLLRGPTSGEGYYLDSHQLDIIVDELLQPFAQSASVVRTAAFDEPSDAPVDVVVA